MLHVPVVIVPGNTNGSRVAVARCESPLSLNEPELACLGKENPHWPPQSRLGAGRWANHPFAEKQLDYKNLHVRKSRIINVHGFNLHAREIPASGEHYISCVCLVFALPPH